MVRSIHDPGVRDGRDRRGVPDADGGRRTLRERTAAFLTLPLAATLAAGPTRPRGPEAAGPAITSNDLAAVVAEARRLAGRLDSVWPGLGEFARLRPLRVVWDPGLHVESGARSAVERASSVAEPFLRVNRGSPDGLWASIAALSGGERDPETAVAWLVAELFRAWTGDRGRGGDRPEAPLRFSNEELAALRDALQAAGAKRARAAARVFVAHRERREADLAPAVVERFRERERRRGLALYTAYSGLRAARHDTYTSDARFLARFPGLTYERAPRLRARLLEALDPRSESGSVVTEPGLSGFALALVLERTVHGWRDAVGPGVPMCELLRAATSTPPDPTRGSRSGADQGGRR